MSLVADEFPGGLQPGIQMGLIRVATKDCDSSSRYRDEHLPPSHPPARSVPLLVGLNLTRVSTSPALSVGMLRLGLVNHLTEARPNILSQNKCVTFPLLLKRPKWTAAQRIESTVPDSRHGANAYFPYSGQRRRRLNYYLTFSPTDLLVQRLRCRGADLTWNVWRMTRQVARSKSPRLPVMAHQFVLRQEEARMETSVSEFLQDPALWAARLNKIAPKGLGEDDLGHWVWILEPDDTDVKVERFLSSDRHKPIFVLMAILRTDEHMSKGTSLTGLYDYIARTYCTPDPEYRKRLPKGILGRTLDNASNMTPVHFMFLINRLVHHCLRTWPSSIVTIARLVASYLRVMPDDRIPNKSDRRTGYSDQCTVFNYAIQNFRRVSSISPLNNLQHNWRAQRILLSFSAGRPRPFIVDRFSYRAIRMVLIGSRKSEMEKQTAIRHSKTWPPYRRQLDGTDEGQDVEKWLSRSVRAGILKRSEGYADDAVDSALDTLGGARLDESITIQTRSGAPRLWSGTNRSLAVFSDWAAKVKATRNAYEAWKLFQEPPLAGIKPNFQVYAEMFSKLFSAEIDYESSILPGDAKEVYPPYQVNLTEFERERLRPLSVTDLYERMLRDGNRPVKHCLALLVRNATSLDEAADYLKDSPLDKTAIGDLTRSLAPTYESLAQIPLQIFHAYIGLLCSQQARKRWVHNPNEPMHTPRPDVLGRCDSLRRAIQLVCVRSGPRRKPAPAPWHTVMRSLAHNKLVIRPWCSQAEDDIEALRTMIRLFSAYEMSEGLHPVPFDCLARCTWKAVREDGVYSGPAPNAKHHIATAHHMLKSAFRELTSPVRVPNDELDSSLPPLYHELDAAHVQKYMEAMASLGDIDEVVHIVEWVLSAWDRDSAILERARDPGDKQWSMLREVFVCFRAFAEGGISEETMGRIEARFEELKGKGSTWLWPRNEDVDDYVAWRREEGSGSG
ncbi:hypothetical protein VMCG_03862 [Cytospora schulzeri]|uniref:Uncharacterized protein n=1 Tax=Cytospora schulzeri TaxID=448051 RepID=A0A423WVE3_9PEZI|nr:hypothetical protein VMCG_03862 [Valsa malicola]